MTLDEAFEKFDDSVLLRRESFFDYCNDPIEKLKLKKTKILSFNIGYLKELKQWVQTSIKMGFFTPRLMIENSNANDWESL